MAVGTFPLAAQRLKGLPAVTWLLTAVNVAVFVYLSLLNPDVSSQLIEKYGLTPYHILHGERIHTLISSMFMHVNLLHLLGNMLYLYVFGCSVETRLKSVRYLMLYLASGVLAGLIHVAVELWSAKPITIYDPLLKRRITVSTLLIPTIGASGAISGVLGAYLVLFPRSSISLLTFSFLWLPVVIRLPAVVFMFFWFLYQLWMGLISLSIGVFTGVAFWAHVGGFIAGLALTPIIAWGKRKRMVYRAGRWWYEIPVG
ncbi:MAG: rhomboid family intramembrane serine protease [Candidatus Nezhaarchaeales archaeon]